MPDGKCNSTAMLRKVLLTDKIIIAPIMPAQAIKSMKTIITNRQLPGVKNELPTTNLKYIHPQTTKLAAIDSAIGTLRMRDWSLVVL